MTTAVPNPRLELSPTTSRRFRYEQVFAMTFKPLIFFPVITLVAVGLHFYLWARLVRATTRSRRQRQVGAIVIAVLGLIGVIGFMVTRTVGVDVRWLAWLGYVWIGALL